MDWQEGDPHGGVVRTEWGEWLPEMQQHLRDNPLDPEMLNITGLGHGRILDLYKIDVYDMYDLSIADPQQIADTLKVPMAQAQQMVHLIDKETAKALAEAAESDQDPK